MPIAVGKANVFRPKLNGKRLMRGTDGRSVAVGSVQDVKAANWARVDDGFEATAPVGSMTRDVSPFGLMPMSPAM